MDSRRGLNRNIFDVIEIWVLVLATVSVFAYIIARIHFNSLPPAKVVADITIEVFVWSIVRIVFFGISIAVTIGDWVGSQTGSELLGGILNVVLSIVYLLLLLFAPFYLFALIHDFRTR